MADASQADKAFTQANSEEKQPIYEVGFHLLPALGEEGVLPVVERIRALLGSTEVLGEQAPQKMTLAYPIERSVSGKREKYTESYFGWIKFTSTREIIPGFQEKLRGMSDVLRYIVIETVKEDIAATPRRAVFTSDRLEGETIKKPTAPKEEKSEVSEEELDKSLESLVG